MGGTAPILTRIRAKNGGDDWETHFVNSLPLLNRYGDIFFPQRAGKRTRHRHVGTEVDSFTQATAHTENLGCCGQILAALVTDAIQPSISLQARTIQCACAVVRIVLCRFIEGLDVCALDTDPCPRSRDWSYCALISQGAGLSCLWPLTPHYLLTPVPQVWRAQWQTFRR